VAMAKRRRVKVTAVAPLNPPIPLIDATADRALDICPIDELLADLDAKGARWKARANAWAMGDVKRLKQLVRASSLRTLRCEGHEVLLGQRANGEFFTETWLTAMDRSLANNSSALAVVEASLLLSDGSLLD